MYQGFGKSVRILAAVLTAALWPVAPAKAQGWTASHQFPTGDPRDLALQALARDTAKLGLTIRIFPSASLLRPRDQWNGLINGTVDMIFTPADYLIDQFPQLAALSLPGMIRSHDQALRVRTSAPMRELRRQIEAEGVVIIADSWIAGTIGGRQKCIQAPDDVRGFRARVIGRYMSDTWAAAGAVPVSAPTSETLGTLVDSQLVDIANTSVTTMLTLKMQRKFTCLTVPGEAGALWYLWEPILVSKKRFDALDEPRRLALMDAGARAQASMDAGYSLIERRLSGDFLAAGVEVVSMDAETLGLWYKLSRRIAWKMFREQVPGGAELLDRLADIQ